MNIFRHTQIETLSNGTSLQGYCTLHFKTLVKIFGEPNGGGSDKSDVSWVIVLQDERSNDERIHVVTIYDWKIGYNYCGEEEGIDVEDNTELQELVSNLPLFPYMEISVKPLCRHPSSVRDDDS